MFVIEAIAPSAWASYLINADHSGLSDEEKTIIDNWIHGFMNGEMPISCKDYGYVNYHDAWHLYPYSADCQIYTFYYRDS